MGRSYCDQCHKPLTVCLCAFIEAQANRFPILILQHTDEQKKPLSTVPLIERGLSQVSVFTGIDFDRNQCLNHLFATGSTNPLLLYPSTKVASSDSLVLDIKTNVSNRNAPLRNYDSLIVLDGTWRNTRELSLRNPWLLGLPTLSLVNVGSSRYRIRKSSHQESLSTIEAIAKVLSLTEESFDTEVFLLPFEKMIDQQIEHMGEEVFQQNYC